MICIALNEARASIGYDPPDESRIEFSETVSEASGTDTNETETNGSDTTDIDTDTTRTVTLVADELYRHAVAAPDGLTITVESIPTNFSPGGSGEL